MYSDKSNILLLLPRFQSADAENDYLSFNAEKISSFFSFSKTYYFYDAILNNGLSGAKKEIESIITDNNISIIFFMPFGSSFELSPYFFKEIKDKFSLKIILFILDDELIFDVFSKYYVQSADAVITCDYYSYLQYEKYCVSAFYYFSSYSKNDFFPANDKKEYDVSFIGDSSKADRREYLDYLKNNGINVFEFGNNSKEGFVNKKTMAEIFSKTRINLNFTKVDSYKFPESCKVWFNYDNKLCGNIRQNKGRPMEIGMTGAFCLSEYSPSMKYTFEPGNEIDFFYDKYDLLEKIKYYLNNENEITRISGNMHMKAANNYAAEIFIPKMLNSLVISLNEKKNCEIKTIFLDLNFKIKTICQLLFIFFSQISGFKIKAAFNTFPDLFVFGIPVFCHAALRFIIRITARIINNFI
ncbi:MAG TPA: glycosyltransferase [bacterium]|nr:glycosyltransferase [bacterium]HPN30534.1 glycosyltransferase [bacterium]